MTVIGLKNSTGLKEVSIEFLCSEEFLFLLLFYDQINFVNVKLNCPNSYLDSIIENVTGDFMDFRTVRELYQKDK